MATALLASAWGCDSGPRYAGATRTSPRAAVADDAQLDRFRTLEGTWDATFSVGGDAIDSLVTYHTTGAGSAVVETLFGGTPNEMVSVIHLDGNRMLMTHYCAAKNQPRLVADAIDENVISFKLLDITNLSDPDDVHMAAVQWEFIDEDHIRTTWTSHANAEVSDRVVFLMVRRPAEN